jgi:enamidase
LRKARFALAFPLLRINLNVMSASSSPSGCLKPLLIGIIAITAISGISTFLVFSRGLYHAPDVETQPIVIQHAQVFDGDSVLAGTPTLVVEDGRISCLGDCDTPADARIIEGRGMSLLPGLIEGYARFYAPSDENLSRGNLVGLLSFIKQRPNVRRHLIAAGVTSFFSAGDLPQNILLLKSQQAEGDLAGPRIRCAGPDFTAPGGFPIVPYYAGQENLEQEAVRTFTVPAEAQQEASKLLGYGLDAIKIVYDDLGGQVPKLDRNVLQALIAVAADKGAYAVVRCGTAEDLRTAAELGARVVAYGPSTPLDSGTVALLREKDVIYYPVLAQRPAEEQAGLRDNLQKLLAAGVAIGIGADPRGAYQQFGPSFHAELLAQVAAGRDPLATLVAATRLNARALRIDDQTGHLAQGLAADLILVQGQPWEDMAAIKRVTWVIQGGRILVEGGTLID